MEMSGNELRIVYMGTPEFAVETLKVLVENDYNVVGVVTVPDKRAGRGQKVKCSAVKVYAEEKSIPILQPEKLKSPEFQDQLKALKPDIQIVVAFRMLPKEVWALPVLGTFNLHASLLPQYRGAAPINWAVINGEQKTGITTFLIDEKIDNGNILLQEEIEIDPSDNAGEIHDKLMIAGSKLVRLTVDGLTNNTISPKNQKGLYDSEKLLKAAPKIFKQDCRIQWSKPALSIHNLIRGLSPYPVAWTHFSFADELKVLKIYAAEIIDKTPENPGTIASDGKTYIHISTKDAWINILELQLEGKKRMKIEDFLRGNKFQGQLL